MILGNPGKREDRPVALVWLRQKRTYILRLLARSLWPTPGEIERA